MTYQILGNVVVPQAIAETSSTQKLPLGRIVQAVDPTYGAGEFIYLKGIGSTVVGSIVDYNANFVTALHTTALDTPSAIAVAMSANVANYYGWYQIGGQAVGSKANTLSLAAGAKVAANAGAIIAAASGLILNGCIVAVVASAKSDVTTVRLMLNRPTAPSDVS